MTGARLTVAQVAALVGVRPATWRAYVSRDQAPRPVEYLDARTPLWDRAVVEAWAAARRRSRPQETNSPATVPTADHQGTGEGE